MYQKIYWWKYDKIAGHFHFIICSLAPDQKHSEYPTMNYEAPTLHATVEVCPQDRSFLSLPLNWSASICIIATGLEFKPSCALEKKKHTRLLSNYCQSSKHLTMTVRTTPPLAPSLAMARETAFTTNCCEKDTNTITVRA